MKNKQDLQSKHVTPVLKKIIKTSGGS